MASGLGIRLRRLHSGPGSRTPTPLIGCLSLSDNTRKGDVMAQQEKCAHPACSCSVDPNGPFGKYCSEHCKKAGGMTELRCGCHHDGCK